jgi:DNA-directed RNA polymerase subunit RPC12/RpoP
MTALETLACVIPALILLDDHMVSMVAIEDGDASSRVAVCADCGRPQVLRRGTDDEPTLRGTTECGRCGSERFSTVEDVTE